MPTSYTTNLRLANPGLGDTGWGTTAGNGMIDLVDPAIAGQASVNVTAAGPFVLTIPDGAPGDARNMFIRATGTPGGAREIQVPTNRKLYFVTNDSDGVVTFKVSGQTGIAVPVGASMALRINAAGTDVVQTLTYQTTLSIGTITLTNALGAASGGTGQTSYAVGDLLYASGTTALSKLAAVATGNVLRSGGVSTAPAWGQVGLTTDVTGTLPIANGGTGQTTQQAAMTALAGAATGGQYLRGNGTNVVMSAIQAADVPTLNQNTTGTASNVTGIVAVANGGTGVTSLSQNQVLLGNGTSPPQGVAPGTSGNVLTSNGTTWQSSTPAAAPVTSVNGLTGAVSMTGLGDIGSYAVLIIATNTNVAVGSTVAGSDLRYGWTPNVGPTNSGSNFPAYAANRSRGSSAYDGGGTSLSGTWRKMSTGATYFVISGCCVGTTYYWCAALYVRIS